MYSNHFIFFYLILSMIHRSRSMPLLADEIFPSSDDEVQVEKKRMEKKETKR